MQNTGKPSGMRFLSLAAIHSPRTQVTTDRAVLAIKEVQDAKKDPRHCLERLLASGGI